MPRKKKIDNNLPPQPQSQPSEEEAIKAFIDAHPERPLMESDYAVALHALEHTFKDDFQLKPYLRVLQSACALQVAQRPLIVTGHVEYRPGDLTMSYVQMAICPNCHRPVIGSPTELFYCTQCGQHLSYNVITPEEVVEDYMS